MRVDAQSADEARCPLPSIVAIRGAHSARGPAPSRNGRSCSSRRRRPSADGIADCPGRRVAHLRQQAWIIEVDRVIGDGARGDRHRRLRDIRRPDPAADLPPRAPRFDLVEVEEALSFSAKDRGHRPKGAAPAAPGHWVRWPGCWAAAGRGAARPRRCALVAGVESATLTGFAISWPTPVSAPAIQSDGRARPR